MSDNTEMFSAAPLKGPTVKTSDTSPPANHFQMVDWRPLPSNEVLQALGRAAIRLGQLEHLLKLIYKRTSEDVSLVESLELTISLGALLNGVHGGKPVEFEGLIHLAHSNPQLALVKTQMEQAVKLSLTRRRYLHNGMGKNSEGQFVGLDSGKEIEEANMLDELNAASTLAQSLLSEINMKIPPTTSGK